MRKISSDDARRTNRIGAIIVLASIIALAVLLALPFYTFSSTISTVKSANTFVGDEKYLTAKAKADEEAINVMSQGVPGDVSVQEQVTLRQNSKGVTTSLVTFNVVSRVSRSGYDFMTSRLPSRLILTALVGFALVGAFFGLASLSGNGEKCAGAIKKSRLAIRGVACWLALIAALMIPVFAMNNNYTIVRRIIPGLTENEGELTHAMDAFIYASNAGQSLDSMVKGLEFSSCAWLWLTMAVLFTEVAGLVLICKGSLKSAIARGGLYTFAVILSVMILYPYYVMLITAFRSNAETTDMYFSNLFPEKWVWTNVLDISERGVPRFLINSLILSFGATFIALLCGIPAAYAMARMSFRGKKAYLGFIIMSQMFAPVVLLVGISRLMNTIGLNDTITGLMFINAAFNQAFAIWLLRGTFVSISSEMEQAACIDGCSTFGALVRVLLPMAAPGIVTTLIFVFINAWNEYTISTVLISTPDKKPITVGITQFSSFNMIEWQYLFASSLIATIPVVILFMFIEKHLVSGLTSGGVKG